MTREIAETREALFHALSETIISAKPEWQAKLAEALEAFASTRGQIKYRRIVKDSPLISGLLETIEEATEARLFYQEKTQ